MEIARTQEIKQGLRVQSRFVIPPRGGTCFINRLPPELLSRILEFGSIAYYASDGDDIHDIMSPHWNNICNRPPDAEEDPDNDVETEEEREHVHVHEADEEEINFDSDSDPTSGSSLCLYQFRVVVSLVCRHWRNVAISTPSLWTSIEVQTDVRPPYDLASKLLKRSQNLPLDILLNCDYAERKDFLKPPVDDIRFLFTMFIPHIPRWRLMVVLVSEYHYMYEFLNAVSDPSVPPASRLTTLRLNNFGDTKHLDSFPYPSMSKHLTLFGGSAALLTTLSLTGGHVDWDQPWIASASNLTFLKLAYHAEDVRPSWAQFATILRGARSLNGLDLCFSGPSGDPQEWLIEPTPGSSADLNAPIPLLRVTYFVLTHDSPTCAIGLLRKFYLPVLKKLSLSLHDGDYTEFVHELAGPATTLLPNEEQPHSLLSQLESLQIDSLDCSTESVKMLCGELQNLESLELLSLTDSQSFCKILSTPCTSTGRSDVWLPRLDELYVSFTSVDDLRSVVQRRREAGVPLSMLRAKNPYGLNNKNEEWFKENAEMFKYIWVCDHHAYSVGEESDKEDDEGSDVD